MADLQPLMFTEARPTKGHMDSVLQSIVSGRIKKVYDTQVPRHEKRKSLLMNKVELQVLMKRTLCYVLKNISKYGRMFLLLSHPPDDM